MGILKQIAMLPAAPIRGTVWVAEQVQEAAEQEYYDPAVIRHQLEQIEEFREAGELTEEEAEAWEDELLERLAESRRRNRSTQGM